MTFKHFVKVFFFILPMFIFSQITEINPPSYIKSITFKNNTPQNQLPVFNINDPITLEFDVLNGDENDFYYKIKHYNFDWTPSPLIQSEYIDGFDNQRIRNYENSFNTYQIYSHYSITIPNTQTRALKISGNYIISIHDSNDQLIFSRKFMLYENKANIEIDVKRSRDIADIEKKQRIEFTVSSGSIQFNNPYQTVKAVIVQNNNLKTAITNIKPQYTLGNQLTYKYNTETSFNAGNEYFYFENKDIRSANNNIQYIDLQDLYHNYLYTNVSRAKQPYTYNPDINGSFLINNIDSENPNIEADYVWMHFSLIGNNELKNKTIHVYGNFNNFSINDETLMSYDASKGVFTNTLLLKQGFYNYKFVVIEPNGSLNESLISGDFWQTENNYKILIYYKELGARYDRLIGVNEASSVNITN